MSTVAARSRKQNKRFWRNQTSNFGGVKDRVWVADQYPGVAGRYCFSARPALEALKLDRPAAVEALEQHSKTMSSSPSPQERRRLAALYLATGNEWSAVVQWRRLAPEERLAADGLSAALVESLNGLLRSRDESNLIAASLAARLGLEGVHPMDDHTADIILARSDPQVWKIVASLWGKNIGDVSGKEAAAAARIGQPGAVKDFYRLLNSPEMQDLYVRNDFAQAAAASGDKIAARDYLAWWHDYTNVRPHSKLGGKTPAEIAGERVWGHAPRYVAIPSNIHHEGARLYL